MSSARRRTARIAITAVLTFVLLELVLQVGAVWVWWTHRDAAEPVAGTSNTVLCVGDSFTFGMGAAQSDDAYPAVLERALQDAYGDSWRVVNVGYPGFDSRRMLEDIDGYLASTQPRFVCIMAGNNDLWSRPERLTLPPYAGRTVPPPRRSFRWELRTVRMYKWLGGKFRRGQPDEPEPDADVHVTSTQPPSPPEPRPQPAPQSQPAAPRISPLKQAWNALRAKEFGRARAVLEPHFDARLAAGKLSTDHEASHRMALTQACIGLGDRDAALAHVDALRALYDRAPSETVASSTIGALSFVGNRDACVELGSRAVLAYPNSAHLASTYAWELFQSGGDATEARAVALRGIELTDVTRGTSRGHQYRRLAQICAATDAAFAASALVHSYLADRDAVRFRQAVGWIQEHVAFEAYEACATALLPDEIERARILEICAKKLGVVTDDGDDEAKRVFEAHLRQLIERSLAAGAQPLLVSYPTARPVFYPIVQRLADEGTPFVRLHSEFKQLLETVPRDELFVSDGHCTSRGYAVIGRRVFEQIAAEL